MRVSDISELKITDISWTERTIRVIQKKTKVSLLLPLPVDAGNAIADYILHSRPRMDSPYVFLRILHPVSGIPVNPTLFNVALREYVEAAGIDRGRKVFPCVTENCGGQKWWFQESLFLLLPTFSGMGTWNLPNGISR